VWGRRVFLFCLRGLIFEHQSDFIGLQETMKRKVDSSVWRNFDLDNSYNWLWSPSVGRSGGIICGIKSSRFNVISASIGRFYVKARVFDSKNQMEYWLVIVYGAAQDEDKDSFLQTLSDICENLDIPALIGGDFNSSGLLMRKIKMVELQGFLMSSMRSLAGLLLGSCL
jgi:hypothetical protein